MNNYAMERPGDIEAWNRRMQGGIGSALPLTFEEVTKDRVVMSMVVDHRVHQPFGVLHGGASVVLAESAGSVGAGLNCPDGYIAMGQEINANHIRGKRDGVVRATAVPVHVGRTSQVWSIEIRDEQDKLICISRLTLAVVPVPAAPAG